MNFVNYSSSVEYHVFLDTYLDVSDFFIDFNTKTNILIGNEYVYNN
jgi:hypothetical protein